MKTKTITVIFKNGETATFEQCLDVYSLQDVWYVFFKGETVKIMVQTYSTYDVALVVNGYVQEVENYDV